MQKTLHEQSGKRRESTFGEFYTIIELLVRRIHKLCPHKNVRYVMSKYNLTHGELVDLPKAYIKQRCNDIRKNEINLEYFHYANIIRDLVNMKDLCYDTIFTQEECN